jgi:hypothetical protein
MAGNFGPGVFPFSCHPSSCRSLLARHATCLTFDAFTGKPDRKIDDRKMPVHGFFIFLSSMFLSILPSILPGCDPGGGTRCGVPNRKLKGRKIDGRKIQTPVFFHFLAIHFPAARSSYRHAACLTVDAFTGKPDRKIDDRKMPVHGFFIFLSSMFLSILPSILATQVERTQDERTQAGHHPYRRAASAPIYESDSVAAQVRWFAMAMHLVRDRSPGCGVQADDRTKRSVHRH